MTVRGIQSQSRPLPSFSSWLVLRLYRADSSRRRNKKRVEKREGGREGMTMRMLLRRRRSSLLLLALMLSSVVYLTFNADELSQIGHGNPRNKVFQSQDEAVQQMYLNKYDTSDNYNKIQISTESTYPDEITHININNRLRKAIKEASKPMKNNTDNKATGRQGVIVQTREKEPDSRERKDSGGKNVAGMAEEKNGVRLLILAYMRTGSSMTGRILQYSPDVFYWYEPLHELERYYVTGGNVSSPYKNATLNESFKSSAMAGDNVSAALSCDVAHVYGPALRYFFMAYGTFSTRLLHPCFAAATTTAQWARCVSNGTSFCRHNFPATAVKTIRLHMSRALEIMRRDPRVKVVHLVRDPRAVLLSRHNLGYADFRKLPAEAEVLCQKYKEDLDLVPRVGDPLRDRYTLLRFEDMAADPLAHTQFLFDLMRVQASKNILRAIRAMTAFVKKSRDCPTCPLLPRNSSYVAKDWRLSMSLSDARTISKKCSKVMNILGYKQDFQDEEQLRNLEVSAVQTLKLV
ncbi:hypothetical protein ACOMHN_018826 [Nucella lapillus]